MRAVQFLGDREAAVVTVPDPQPGPGQALLRMVRAAVCGSDLHGYRRPKSAMPATPVFPGHEPVGVIEALGPGVQGLQVGQRVLLYHRPGCGACPQCLSGQANICSGTPRPRGGSDADYELAYAERFVPLPDDMDWDTAVVIACQAGTAYAPLKRLGASGRDVLVVSGLGPVGLCAVMLGRAMGAHIIGVDPVAERRALAERFGAARTINPLDGDLEAQVRAEVPEGADGVIETSGNPAAQAAAVDLVRVEGTIALVGLGHAEPSIAPAKLFRRQVTVFGSNLYAQAQLPEIFTFVQRRRVPLASIITHRFPLAEAPAAFRLADTATTGKIVFTWE